MDRPHVRLPGDPFTGWFGAFARWRPTDAPATIVPATPNSVSIRVLGELDVCVDGGPAGENMRRRRVRTMLELLALMGPMRRERLADMMWPDLDQDTAAANLRVTLSRLRALIGAEAVAADSQRVALDPARGVRIDLWDFERDVAAAGNALQAGDIDAHVAALERACGRWIGEPLADVDAIDGVTAEVEAVRRQLAATALRLASLQLDRRRYDEAARWAARVRAAAPYDERAHRVLIAAHLGRGDQTAACEAAEATLAALAELDVDPEADTSALVEAALARPLSLMLATRTARARR